MQAHAPVQDPHRQTGRSAVEHGACVQADDDDHEDTEEMGEVEKVEVACAHSRQGGDGQGEHDESSEAASEDERGAPDSQGRIVTRPGL